MKKRIITFLLTLLLAFSILTPAFACGGTMVYIIEDYAHVLSTQTFGSVVLDNYNITGDYEDVLISVVTLESWDGDFSSESVSDAMKDLHINNLESSIGMTIIFDIEQGNYGILTGGVIDDLFDDAEADERLEYSFRRYYEAGNYDLAVTSLTSSLARWYEQNYDQVMTALRSYKESIPWYRTTGFIILAAIIFLVLLHILYGVFARIAHLNHSFDKFYIEQNLPIPAFKISHIRSAPFYCDDERSIWSYIGDLWKEVHPFHSCFEPSDVKQNKFDIIAKVIKLILLVFIRILMLIVYVFALSGGGSGGGSGGSRSRSSSRSSSSSSSSGGGRGSGGGGGRR